MELADTSVLVLGRRRAEVGRWVDANGDQLAITDLVALEYLMGARSGADYRTLEDALGGFVRLSTEPADWSRAREVHRQLAMAGPGHQRSVKLPDLVIAAVGERNGVGLVHYDADYDRIAAITGQPTRWIVPRGTT